MTQSPGLLSRAERHRAIYDALLATDLGLDHQDPLERELREILEAALRKLERPFSPESRRRRPPR